MSFTFRRITPRSGLPTRGPAAARLAAALGVPFLPWQRQLFDLLLEYDPETGHYVHRHALVLVPRQAGKTFATGLLLQHRALTLPRARCWYTAQSQSEAEQWLRDEHAPMLARTSALDGQYRARFSAGSHAISWSNGSIVRVFAPKRDSLHGKQSDLVDIDEAWAFDAATGDELLQAVGPTQATRPGAQLVLQSAAGDERSAFLIAQLLAARADHDSGRHDVVLIEAGVPDGLDATDPAVVARYHPAVGHTIDPAHLRVERARLGPDGFARAYGAVQVIPEVTAGVLPLALWQAGLIVDDDVRPPVGACSLTYDVAIDRSDAAVAAAWTHTDGRTVVALLEHHPGVGWVESRVRQLRDQLRPHSVAHDARGPAGDVADRLARSGVTLVPMDTRAVLDAYERFLTAHDLGQLAHLPAPPLDAALLAAGRRPVGDRYLWARRTSSGSIAPLVAVTHAAWAHEHAPSRKVPVFRSR